MFYIKQLNKQNKQQISKIQKNSRKNITAVTKIDMCSYQEINKTVFNLMPIDYSYRKCNAKEDRKEMKEDLRLSISVQLS